MTSVSGHAGASVEDGDEGRPDQHARGVTFARLHEGPGAFVVPNPWDAGSAVLLESLGFKALATTSGGLAFSLGLPDGAARLGRDQVLENVAAITAATSLQLTVDLESGYGARPEDVAETVLAAAAAGAVGASIEDTIADRDAPVRPLPEALERAEAAVAAARSLPFPFTLTIRADNFFAGVPDLPDTIERLVAFEQAGADVLSAPGLRTVEAVREVLAAISTPFNVLAVPAPGFSVPDLARLGVRRVSVGSALARAAFGALLTAGTRLRDEGTVDFAAEFPTYAELNALMGRSST